VFPWRWGLRFYIVFKNCCLPLPLAPKHSVPLSSPFPLSLKRKALFACSHWQKAPRDFMLGPVLVPHGRWIKRRCPLQQSNSHAEGTARKRRLYHSDHLPHGTNHITSAHVGAKRRTVKGISWATLGLFLSCLGSRH
jgi:hypothetical protein